MTPRELASLAKSLGGVVREHVAKAIGDISTKLSDLERRIAEIPAGKDGRDGADGKSVTVDEVLPVLCESVMDTLRLWFDEMPRPRDGIDGKDGKDGVDGKSITLEDVQPILENAVTKWALEFERRAQDTLQRAIDRMPAPKDGRDGKDGANGRDAFQLEDIELSVADDDRTLTLAFVREGARVERSIRLNHPIYRGIWKEGAYEKGDCVTFGGSAFIATRETTSKPETDDSWKLCVKRGRDGKDGAKGEKGERGERGPKGEPPVELTTGKIR